MSLTNDPAGGAGAGAGTNASLIRNVASPGGGTRWEEFDQTYRGIVFGMARRAGLGHHDSEDVTQDVFRDLARSLCGFELGDRQGSFRRYLSNLVRWRVASKFERRKQYADQTLETLFEDPGLDFMDSLPAPEPVPEHLEADFREAVTQAMVALARDLPARHVQLLDLYFCKEWSAKRVAAALSMPTATVFTIAHRNKLRLMREIMRRL